ncbi:MAG: PA14 domain-containing protein [Chloroflexota bacterium]|nr:PA14 domain-containing protein [Chloroflexota bacterium]
MDGPRFDAFTLALTKPGPRRKVLRGLVAGALSVTMPFADETATAHNIMAKCQSMPFGKKRKRCIRKARKHRRWHKLYDQPALPTCASNLYTGRYFNNAALAGSPVLVRCENWPINYNWGYGSPGGGVPSDNFSVRWTGRSYIDEGVYDLLARGDDGIRVWFGSQLVIDQWYGALPETRKRATIEGGTYDLTVEYRELGGGAVVFFRWDYATCDGAQIACSSSVDCCGSLSCAEDYCYSGYVCCAQTGQVCAESCDCCDNDYCGSDYRCHDPGTFRSREDAPEKNRTSPRRSPVEIKRS